MDVESDRILQLECCSSIGDGYRFWMAVDESMWMEKAIGDIGIFSQSDRDGYRFWMAMDESIRMERVDVMWCRLGISFDLSLEFWNSVYSNRVCKFSDFTSYRDLKLIESISGTFRLIGSVLKEIEFFSIFWVYVYRVLRNSRIHVLGS